MILIDGKKIAADLREELRQEVVGLKSKHNKIPGLTVILIGDMAPSQIYVRMKEKAANEVGLKSEVIRYPEAVEQKKVLDKIEARAPRIRAAALKLGRLNYGKTIDYSFMLEFDEKGEFTGRYVTKTGKIYYTKQHEIRSKLYDDNGYREFITIENREHATDEQLEYNKLNNITPLSIKKSIDEILESTAEQDHVTVEIDNVKQLIGKDLDSYINKLEKSAPTVKS